MAGGMGQVWALVLFNKIATIVNAYTIKFGKREQINFTPND